MVDSEVTVDTSDVESVVEMRRKRGCPDCGNDDVSVSLNTGGYGRRRLRVYVHADCSCGWSGKTATGADVKVNLYV